MTKLSPCGLSYSFYESYIIYVSKIILKIENGPVALDKY